VPHQAVLAALDRSAADLLSWLKRVHAALLFGAGRPEPLPELPDLLRHWAGSSELPPTVADERRAAMDAVLGSRRTVECQAIVLSEGPRPISAAGYETFMAAVEGYSGRLRLLEALMRQSLAETDPLTGVSNRLGMMRELEREAQRARRTDQPCCIAILDLDHFKAINDTHGHPAGDLVLGAAARFFVRRLRPYDRVYRIGGEEFLFCLPDTELDSAARVLDRLRSLLAREAVPVGPGRSIRVTASIGVAALTGGPRALEHAIARADAAVYAAKAAGRNRIVVADETHGLARPIGRRSGADEASPPL
jgi:diguanylate cyclase (GGDEF)-like protein